MKRKPEEGNIKNVPCTSFSSRHAGAWLIHHLGNVSLENEELISMQHEYQTSKTNKEY